MKTYSKMPDECTDRVKHLLKLFHPALVKVGLRIDLISVTSDAEEGGSPLTHQGYPAYAVIRIIDSKGRLMGRGDVEIVIDEESYLHFSEAQKDALLDHELYHVELKIKKKTGKVKLDEHGRPMVGMRKHDYQFGWFREIAQRHGAASIECDQARKLFINEQQIFFFFVDEPKLSLERSKATVQRFVDSVPDGSKVTISSGGETLAVIDKT